MDLKRLKLAKECIGIINQLYDLAEVPTEKRQAINDKADKYLLDQVLRLCAVSQRSELLFCGGCGNKKQLIVETDINSQRVCKNKLCEQNNCG